MSGSSATARPRWPAIWLLASTAWTAFWLGRYWDEDMSYGMLAMTWAPFPAGVLAERLITGQWGFCWRVLRGMLRLYGWFWIVLGSVAAVMLTGGILWALSTWIWWPYLVAGGLLVAWATTKLKPWQLGASIVLLVFALALPQLLGGPLTIIVAVLMEVIVVFCRPKTVAAVYAGALGALVVYALFLEDRSRPSPEAGAVVAAPADSR